MKLNFFYVLPLLVCISAFACSKPTNTTDFPNVTEQVRTVHVSTANELKDALLNAKAGDDIVMADGLYSGKFIVAPTVNGTVLNYITLEGTRNAILDAGSTTTGYVLYLQANYWKLKGFTVKNGLKGIMTDGANFSIIDSVFVTNIGEEGIHLRKFSTHNIIQNCEITYTGVKTPDYGEGIYIGTAKSNWSTVTNGEIDKCDSNKVLNNKVGPYVAAECIDIKEGTTGGLIASNSFNAQGIQGANSADSWIDVKGNYYLIDNNTGNNFQPSALLDGYQVNCAYNGWGCYNEFKNNICNVNASGYGFNVRLTSSSGNAIGNKVYSTNKVTGATSGISNIPLSN